MNTKEIRKNIWIFLGICIPVSNVLWYLGGSLHAQQEESAEAMSIMVLTSFLPALTALILCKANKEGWDGLMILPNVKKAWRVYLFAVLVTWFLVYMGDPLMLLLFPGEVSYAPEGCSVGGWIQVLFLSLLGVLCSVEMLGEELGWLGFLFPKLERLHGTNLAVLLLSLIRTVWHLGILIFLPHPFIGACDLFLSNLFSQSLLVYLTKKSSSLFPAAVVHALTNLLPIFLTYSDDFYNENIIAVNCAGLFSAAVTGALCYWLMRREKMIQCRQRDGERE